MADISHLFHKRQGIDFNLYDIDIFSATDHELIELSSEMGIGLSLEEMHSIRQYYKKEGRMPTDLELQAIGQAWSEHACYKSSKIHLKANLICIDRDDVLSRGDAGVMAIDDEYAYALRIESHNHPSAIEPYGGAATGIGGIVRDVLAMGAQPIALIDPLFFGPLNLEFKVLPKGIKHPKYLFSGVVAGIRDYGNRLGIPTVSGTVCFHPGYIGNCLVNVGCVGILKRKNLMNNFVRDVGDLFVLVGGLTGRDGIHGVTFASAELHEASEEESLGAVQLGDPVTEEAVIHATLECVSLGLLEGLKDLGGGGLSCVIGEMALHAGFGAEVYLDKVPLKESNMSPWEIWVSESQERMMLAVKSTNLKKVLDIFDLYDIKATVVGKVIPEKRLRIWYHNTIVADTHLEFIYDAPVYDRPYIMPVAEERVTLKERDSDISLAIIDNVIKRIISDPNIASKSWVVRQYDHEVRAATVIKPFCGSVLSPSPTDATVMKPIDDRDWALAIGLGVASFAAVVDPYKAGKLAMDEVCRNLVAVGARPHAITNCLNFGNPEKPDRMGEFVATVRGIGEVAKYLNIPIPSGNVSFYNESVGYKVPPTSVIMGVGLVDNINDVVTPDLKVPLNPLYHIGTVPREMGGTAYYHIMGYSSPFVPDVDVKKQADGINAVINAIKSGTVVSCHDISDGGLITCVLEMAFGGGFGLDLDLEPIMSPEFKRPVETVLFAEGGSRWIVEVTKERENEFLEIMGHYGVEAKRIGKVTDGRNLTIRFPCGKFEGNIFNYYEIWESALWKVM